MESFHNFNSIMVRLKVNVPARLGNANKFQFHNGSIKGFRP